MATSQGIRAAKAYVELLADDSKLVRGLRAAQRQLKAFGAGIGPLGTKMLGVGTAVALVGKAFAILSRMIGALMSPIGLVLAGLAALATYLVTSTEVGGKARCLFRRRQLVGSICGALTITWGGTPIFPNDHAP